MGNEFQRILNYMGNRPWSEVQGLMTDLLEIGKSLGVVKVIESDKEESQNDT